ncbi:hypothetical protein JI743_01230 [Sphingopyxis sp. DHUNG17]|uniref:hypothetical protein n=1 Tax=Sphingopyxis jiangsuensis TaxID=2871171 RepID=UPI00191FB283|nr:hypothetical protein [Sphingopyxis lutea]MBL0767426.1 hypothetical protein [Sphingopyxis lutea]
MHKMSIGAAFSETFAFLKANWTQMLIYIGGALVLLGILGYLMLGATFAAMASPTADPSVAFGAVGSIVLFALLAAIILYAACMLVWRGGLHPGEAPNFGWALQAGPAFAFGMFVVMIAAYVVILVISFVLMLIFGAAFGLGGGLSPDALQSGAVGGGAIVLLVLFYIAILLFMLWVQARFSVAGPVMADRLTRNPVTGLSESWRLTGTSQWVIVGFYVLFTLMTVAYMFVVGLVLGGIMGAMMGGSGFGSIVALIISAIVIYLPLLLISFSIPVGIYRALSPKAASDVFA